MKFNILTLFPQMFAPLRESMIGRAISAGLIELDIINIRDFSLSKQKKADDYSYGGGAGMIMLPQPMFDALDHVNAKEKKVIYMSPRGRVLNQQLIMELSSLDELVILCGHYEGVDQRVLDYYDAEEISVGDYILTGGELPAMILIDSLSRTINGVLKSHDSAFEESIYSGLLEYPQYTKPREIKGIEVPEVLVSGNHEKIDLWRFEQSLILTKKKRPDLFEKFVKEHGKLTKSQQKVLENIIDML